MEADEGLYHAVPQTRGRIAHESVDNKSASTRKTDILSMSVCSNELGVMGKIDLYRGATQCLIERKYQLKQIFRGQIYQLWAQYFCMIEMGYPVTSLAFYEISTNRMIPVELPGVRGRKELVRFIQRFKSYTPDSEITINSNKCGHCIYCNLCDKTFTENVYT
jgi:CRISPR-associated protein Cas4